MKPVKEMESNVDILLSLFEKGIKVWVEGAQLRFVAPRGKLLPEEKERIHRHRLELIKLLKQAEVATELPLRARPVGYPVPLTALQLRVWEKIEELRKLDGARAFGLTVRINGILSKDALRRSIETVVLRHESLRTRFVATDSGPRQRIDLYNESQIAEIDLSTAENNSALGAAIRIAEETVNERAELSTGPLFEAKLLRISDREHVLVLALDHIITDYLSKNIIFNEIWSLYHRSAQGRELVLPDLPIQFGDYALWQQQSYGYWMERHEQYWRARLHNAPKVKIPAESTLREKEHPACSVKNIFLGDQISAVLRSIAASERTSLGLVVFSIYAVAMSRWCNQLDLLVYFVTSGRYRPELVGMVGPVAGLLYLRVYINQSDSFIDLLKQVSMEYILACDHRDFDRLPGLFPDLFTEVGFNWLPVEMVSPNRPETGTEITIRPLALSAVPQFKFAPVFFDTSDGIMMTVRYRDDLIAHSTIDRFANDFCALASVFSSSPKLGTYSVGAVV